MLVRTVEAAAKKHGSDKLTGEIIYRTLLDHTIPAKELFGFTSGDVSFTTDAPFPSGDVRINIGSVVGGKIITVAPGIPVPKLEKW